MKNDDEYARSQMRVTKIISTMIIVAAGFLLGTVYAVISEAPFGVIAFGLLLFSIDFMAFPFVYDALIYRKLD